jgi:glycosyltransferase involved in cell wall biosynthesis
LPERPDCALPGSNARPRYDHARVGGASTRRLTSVGINALFLRPQMGGIETYVRELVPALLETRPDLRVVVFAAGSGLDLLAAEPWADDVELADHPAANRRYARALSEVTLVGRLASRHRLDVLHSVALLGPLLTKARSVVTVGDVTWLREPASVERTTRLVWRTLVPAAVRRAARVITYSEASRREIAEDLPVDPDRIDVIPLGPGKSADGAYAAESELRQQLGLGMGPIVLAVSALSAHKNVDTLVRALPGVVEAHPDAVLVVPGNRTAYGERLETLAQSLGVGRSLALAGWVSDAQLEGLYRAAACFAFPSTREGFGLPVLEAMRRGVPVACSDASAIPEVAGDAAVYFDPSRPFEIASAVNSLLDDRALAERLIVEGRRRAALFSWQRAASETIASYERALTA